MSHKLFVRFSVVVLAILFVGCSESERPLATSTDKPNPVVPGEPEEPEATEDSITIADAADWEKTSMSYDLLKSELSDRKCNESQDSFYGCVAVVNAAFQFSDLKYLLGSEESFKIYPNYHGKVLKDFGFMKVGLFDENQKTSKSRLDLITEAKRLRAGYLREIAKMYSLASLSAPVNFTEIFVWLEKELPLLRGKLEKAVAGHLLNVYYSTAIDPHTVLWSKAALDRVVTSSESLVGIGAVLKQIDKSFFIERTIEGGPAANAGILAGDEIISIDGFRISNLSISNVVNRIRGPKDSQVKIRIRRGNEKKVFVVVRATVRHVIENVIVGPASHAERVVHIRVQRFSEGICRNIAKKYNGIIEKFSSSPEGLILDLRDNGGGELEEAICVVSLFVGRGHVVVIEKTLEGRQAGLPLMTRDVDASRVSVAVLVNARSASASEIVAGDLQHYGKLVIGDRTYGKASVQGPDEDYEKSHPGSGVTLMKTIYRYYLASDITPQNQGVSPDIFVYHKPNPSPEEIVSLREEDDYANALPSIGKVWVQPRPEFVSSIEKCVSEKGDSLKLWTEGQKKSVNEDYQLLYAVDALRCLPTP